MQNPRLAGRYAKSLVDLAVETNQLEAVYNDMKFLRAVGKSSREFVTMMQSPVVPPEKKVQILDAIGKGNISELTASFLRLLVTKSREFFVLQIIDAVIDQYNVIKGIHKIKLTTAVEVGDDVKAAIVDKIKRDTTIQNIELESVVKEELIGGFVLEFNNNLVDASILRDLRDVRKQFDQNFFMQQIR